MPPRIFVRRSPTLVDVDYFKIAWTHLTVDASQYAAADKEMTVSLLIVNSQHGQYATDYDASHDIAHISMKVGTSPTRQESFAIQVTGSELSMRRDTLVWTVPIAAK